jgi:hypothetical protein
MENRIGNLEFRKATYLCEEPEHPSYHIDYWYPNADYGTEKEYNIDETGEWYYKEDFSCRKHKSCFKYPESCFAIASFDYDKHEDFYELHFIGDRPKCLSEKEREIFWELFLYGNEALNNSYE